MAISFLYLSKPVPIHRALDAVKRQDFAEALRLVSAIDVAGYSGTHFLIKGLSELALKDWEAARGTFAAAVMRLPCDAIFWLNKGVAEENLERIDEAVASQEECLRLNPQLGEACGNLSNLYRLQRKFVPSEEMARRAIELLPIKTYAFNGLGLALAKQGRYDEADAAYCAASQTDPRNARIVLNRANLAVDRLRFDEAWPLFAQARALTDEPVFRRDEGLARLLVGDYAHGFELFESRLTMPHALRLRLPWPMWRGENLAGKKLMIVAEQGFGDVIQFCRYQEFLPDGELVWAVPQPLVRLLGGVLRGQVLYEMGTLPVCDYYVPVMSLLWVVGHYAIPHGVWSPGRNRLYLSAPSVPVLPVGKHARKIGLVWAGSRTHERDHQRSIPLSMFEPIVRGINADFYAPFTGEALGDIGDLPITRLDHLCGDFADTAALIAQMDCVITVDTVAAHLAGALGVKTFLLLPHCPDWRWGLDDENTAWYPSLTLLRQPAYGDWEFIMIELNKKLNV